MEDKIYDRQVTKQSLSFRVVDQQQIERHFTMNELTELYSFEPDQLDDPSEKKSKRSTPMLPKVRGQVYCNSHIAHRMLQNTERLQSFEHVSFSYYQVPASLMLQNLFCGYHAAFELYRG